VSVLFNVLLAIFIYVEDDHSSDASERYLKQIVEQSERIDKQSNEHLVRLKQIRKMYIRDRDLWKEIARYEDLDIFGSQRNQIDALRREEKYLYEEMMELLPK
jgi:hypothetical protein